MAVSLQDLRRVADALDGVRGRDVLDAAVRPDLRQFRLTFSGGSILVVGVGADADGHGRLEVDIVRPVEEATHQLDVPFEPSAGSHR
ncbi:MAG: hypothetical protein ACREL2_02280 [Gemmatimonadales bacterium]